MFVGVCVGDIQYTCICIFICTCVSVSVSLNAYKHKPSGSPLRHSSPHETDVSIVRFRCPSTLPTFVPDISSTSRFVGRILSVTSI